FGFLFNPDATDEMKQVVIAEIGKKLDYIDQRLGDGPYLFGQDVSLPDPYLFVMTSWAEKMLGRLERWPHLKAFHERMLDRPAVRHVLRFEGLLQEEPAA
ncbi:MAG: glutathione S-transferase, partial [Sphingomonadales bacterium]|nr:glutathione S-transferase [Sphingomonadales bacterium]